MRAAGDPFLVLNGPAGLPARLRGAVVAIGNFDGVHRGHQAVLERALDQARALSAPAILLTFEPHPRKFFRPDLPLPRLTPAPVKAALAQALGLDAVIVAPFDATFAAQTAEAFVTGILVGDLGVVHAVTGFDFHFGRNRQGGPAFLMDAGERLGFGVTLVDAYRDEGAEVISSSRIRELLASGEIAGANGLLGYRYTVEAPVIGGERLGRTLGYPTANMSIHEDCPLAPGIYAVRFRRADGSLHDGVASYGRRPTVTENGAPLLETFLFGFEGDLYGETARVSLFGFLRGEEKFASLDALTDQMRRDEAEARALLSGVRPLSDLDASIAFP
ncbi:MAG: bifunctional riboflavin kinase/FAD synthetase [Rhizobiaceae bacterium]|nr:bifunctional riboflavin kinase/FAD synthetase [Rhizobiaceae bacterium]MCV0406154.1 bifunctional riboflavin kinase/FAD synthetase [Rhizobiaceae bacterium]